MRMHEIIKDYKEKIKRFFEVGERGRDLAVIAIIFLVGTLSFGLGRLSVLMNSKKPLKIIYPSQNAQSAENKNKNNDQTAALAEFSKTATETKNQNQTISPSQSGGEVVASKNGTKYHFPWCSGAKSISPTNLITFKTIEEARAAGYLPATNCKGLR